MEFTKEELERFKNDPFNKFLASIFDVKLGDLFAEEEEKSKSRNNDNKNKNSYDDYDEDLLGKNIKKFFDKMVEDGKATATVEDGHPHYSIKLDDDYVESENPETLVEEKENTNFTMTKEELSEFIRDYTKLENTFKKLEHTYGIDLNANADSIYTQYNALVWTLIEKIFGQDNRDDIADYCFGNSNFDTVEDLYEELI